MSKEIEVFESNLQSLNKAFAELKKKISKPKKVKILAPDWFGIDKCEVKIVPSINISEVCYDFPYNNSMHSIDVDSYVEYIGSGTSDNVRAHIQEVCFSDLENGDWFLLLGNDNCIFCKMGSKISSVNCRGQINLSDELMNIPATAFKIVH